MKPRLRIAFLQRTWEDNLGILWLSAILKEHGFQTRVWIHTRAALEEIVAYHPAILCFSCMTGEQEWVSRKAQEVRQRLPNLFTIVGGPHPTFFPEMITLEGIDAICRGEGEGALLELAEYLEAGKKPTEIRNLVVKTPAGVVRNPLRPLVENLDDLPFPDRTHYERYPVARKNPFKIFISSRGCPFRCTFCFNHAFHGLYGPAAKFIRRRSVDNLLREIEQVQDVSGIGEIRFSDDHFALDGEWLKRFAPEYKRRIGRPYSINARVDSLDEEKIRLLAKSGCRLVCFGVESGREDLRNQVLKKQISDRQLFQVAGWLKKHGIAFLSSNIIGLPDEAPSDAWKTIEMNQALGTDLPWYSLMQYFPGTEIFDDARRRNLIPEDFDVRAINGYFSNEYIWNPHLAELQNIHSFSIVASWFPSISWMAKILAKTFPPNKIFRFVFFFSYFLLTAKRANYPLRHWLRIGSFLSSRVGCK